MRKKYLIAGAIAACAATAALMRKNAAEYEMVFDDSGALLKICRKGNKNTRVLNLTNALQSDRWNPLDIIKTSGNKKCAAEYLSELILRLSADKERKDILQYITERDLLTSILLYVDSTEDNTLMHVYDVIAEMASLGTQFRLQSLPEIHNTQWATFHALPNSTRQSIIEDLLAQLDKYEIEEYTDVLQNGNISLKDFLKGKYEITLVESKERPLLSLLFENLIVDVVK